MRLPMKIIISVSSIVSNQAFAGLCESIGLELTPYDTLSIYLLILWKVRVKNKYINFSNIKARPGILIKIENWPFSTLSRNG